MKAEKKENSRKGQKIRNYTLAFKHQTVREIEASGMNAPQAVKFYNVPENTIRDWLKLYGSSSPKAEWTRPLSLAESDRLEALEEENKALHKAMAESKKKIIGLETLIDVAEEELSIKIRKKSGTKQ